MGCVRPAIDVRAVHLRARSADTTLRDVSITIGHGELVALVGGSGSGKDALLEVMGGVRTPSSGAIDRMPGNIGYVPIDGVLHPQLPLARALGYRAALRGLPSTAVDKSLATVGLAGRADGLVGDLGPGERRRAALALALLGAPSLLFLDEPASGVEPVEQARLMRMLRAFTADGMTVVMTVTHPPDAELCDKVAVLADGGHLAFFGTPYAARDYFGADTMEEIYERLAGAGDPRAAWSRRYFRFLRTTILASPPSLFAPAPPAYRQATQAGAPPAGAPPTGSGAIDGRAGASRGGDADGDADGHPGPGPGPGRGRQLAVLTMRNADVLSHTGRLTIALLAGPPLAALVALSVLFRAGPLHGAPVMWLAFSGFFFGLACGLPQVAPERGILRHERRPEPGAYGTEVYVLAKAAVLIPPLVVVDALFLALLDALGGLPGFSTYGPTYLTLLLCTAAALGAGLLVSAAVRATHWAVIGFPAAFFPLLLLSYGVAAGHSAWPDWLALGAATAASFIASSRYLTRDD
jgi:ABC-type multidrug transport system ATPase subunit